MFTLNRHLGGSTFELGRLDSAQSFGDFEGAAIAVQINPASNDRSQTQPKGFRHQVPDPTRPYVVPIPWLEPGNGVRSVAATNPGGDPSDGMHTGPVFWKTPTMRRRQEALYKLLVKDQQGWLFSDRGTWSSPYTGFDLGSIRPSSFRRWN